MNNNSLKSLLLAGAVALSLSTAAVAATDPGTPVTDPSWRATGLLGNTYGSFEVSFLDIDDLDLDATNYHFGLNQGVRAGLDSQFDYNYTRSESFMGTRVSQHFMSAGVRAYTTMANGIKPYAEGGLGWAWFKGPFGVDENSWAFYAGVGAEIVVTDGVSVTPLIRFSKAPEISDSDVWDFGVKGDFWLNEKLGLTAGIMRDDEDTMSYTLGVHYRY